MLNFVMKAFLKSNVGNENDFGSESMATHND